MMRETTVSMASTPAFYPASTGILQRKCACGQHTSGGECARCRTQNMVVAARGGMFQHLGINHDAATEMSGNAYSVLGTSGEPLNPIARALVEPRFSHDFSRVSILPRSGERWKRSVSTPDRFSSAAEGQRSAFAKPATQPVAETFTWTNRYRLSATIPTPVGERDADGTKSGETSITKTFEAPKPVASAREFADGETAELPVFFSSYPENADADSISATLTYSPSVAVSPDEPKSKDDFGFTWGNHVRTSGGRIHKEPGRFEVEVTYENPIVIKVYKDTGPHDQTNIESENDPDIESGNFAKVASDLTPGKDNRPPRTKFWARDLTLAHEQFHAKDGQKFCKDAVAAEQAALNKQTASTKNDVNDLLKLIPDRIIAARAKGMEKPASEDRAYADGAPAYKGRADKISAMGKAGKYANKAKPKTEEKKE